MELIRNIRNELDFFLRSAIRFERPVPADAPTPARDQFFQRELAGFFALFPWADLLASLSPDASPVVLDVGARNFASAPVMDTLFATHGFLPEVHGIELDAFRRYSDFRSRFDYGKHYAAKIRRGFFHAEDFLKFDRRADVIFLLNPFVSTHPLLAWGLPLRALNAQAIFDHCARLLKPGGFVVLSTPSSDEYRIALECASRAGLRRGVEGLWEPDSLSLSKMPRHGRILTLP